MKITQCPNCKVRFNASSLSPGQSVKCGKCKTVFKIQFLENEKPVEVTPAKPSLTKKPRYRKLPVQKKSKSKLILLIVPALLLLCAVIAFVLLSPKRTTNSNQQSAKQQLIIPEKSWYEKLADFEKTVDKNSVDGLIKIADFCLENNKQEDYIENLIEAFKLEPENATIKTKISSLIDELKPANNLTDFLRTVFVLTKKFLNANSYTYSYKLAKKIHNIPRDNLKKDDNEYINLIISCEEKIWDKIFEDESVKNQLLTEFDEIEKKIVELIEGLRNDFKQKPMRKLPSPTEKKIDPCDDDTEYFSWHYSKPYLICIQNDRGPEWISLHENVPNYCSILLDRFFKSYGEKLNIKNFDNKVFVMWIFSTWDNYADYKKKNNIPHFAAAHYDLNTKRFFLYKDATEKLNENVDVKNDAGEQVTFENLFFHEGMHQIVYASFEIETNTNKYNLWFHEGFATFIDSFKRKDDDWGFGVINKARLENIYRNIKENSYVKFKDFLSMSQYFDVSPPSFYAQAWSIVYFFHTYKDGKYKEKFIEYFKKVISGSGDINDFTQIFGDLNKIENEWKEYILTLEPFLRE